MRSRTTQPHTIPVTTTTAPTTTTTPAAALPRFLTHAIPITLAVVGLFTIIGCSSQSPPTKTANDFRALPILVQQSGDNSALFDPGVFLINSGNDLNAMGLIDTFDNIDFSRQSLVVLALGERPTGGYSAHIIGIQQAPEGVYVQGIAYAPSPEMTNTAVITHPYDAVIVPKVVGTVFSEIESQVDTQHTP